ncbi:MAG: flagellar basal-body MS-ring/collar protein FliF [Rickettsiaceae bacterium]
MQVIIQFFKDTSPIRLAAAVGTILFLIIFIVFISNVNNSDMAVLYSDLDLEDSSKVVHELEKRNIRYVAEGNGTIIKVKKSEVINTRLALAYEGLPSSGSVVGYEIFDKEDSIGATNFSQNIKMVRALEGELSRTISAFEQVDKARVHLVIPQREIFSKERLEPRASIVLKFKGTRKLNKNEIDALSHLVVTAVPGLEMRNITIVDNKGTALKIGSSEEGEFNSSNNEEIRIAHEVRLRKIIEELLARSLGEGNVKAQVSLAMNFDRIVTSSETYDPDGAVVRSTQSMDEKERTPVSYQSQDASVANNIPGGNADEQASNQFAIIEKSDQTTNYEISKTVKNHISESGLIQKMSIGILVDGIYKNNPDTGESEYQPRSKEEIAKIIDLVKAAVGFDEDRHDKIEVINIKFASAIQEFEDDSDWLKEELPHLFQTIVFAIVLLLILITVIRPIALKAFEVKKINQDALDEPGFVDNINSTISSPISSTETNIFEETREAAPKSAPISKINDVATANPQDLVNILRKWLDEGR